MRTNLHPLRNLPVGTDPSVLTSDGMSVTGSAVVSMATVKNLAKDVMGELCTAAYWRNDVGFVLPTKDMTWPEGSQSLRWDATSLPHNSNLGGSWNSMSGGAQPWAVTVGRAYSLSALVRNDGDRDLTLQARMVDIGVSASATNTVVPAGFEGRMTLLDGVVADSGIDIVDLIIRNASGQPYTGSFHLSEIMLTQSLDPMPFVNPLTEDVDWDGVEHGSPYSVPVPAWNPLANGGAGGFDDSLQAVRVYWPDGADAPARHRLVLTADDDHYWGLTHYWTDDPGSVGKTAHLIASWQDSGGSFISGSSVTSSLVLSAVPQSVLVAAVPKPAPGAKLRVEVRRQGTGECNLLYSASQVSPHSIKRYNDERSHGHELVDPDAYWKGSRSLKAPIEYDASARLYIPETRLRLNNGIN